MDASCYSLTGSRDLQGGVAYLMPGRACTISRVHALRSVPVLYRYSCVPVVLPVQVLAMCFVGPERCARSSVCFVYPKRSVMELCYAHCPGDTVSTMRMPYEIIFRRDSSARTKVNLRAMGLSTCMYTGVHKRSSEPQ